MLIGKNEGEDDASVYTEIVIAPGFSEEALALLKAKQKKKMRIIQTAGRSNYPYDLKVIRGSGPPPGGRRLPKKLDRSTARSPDQGKA